MVIIILGSGPQNVRESDVQPLPGLAHKDLPCVSVFHVFFPLHPLEWRRCRGQPEKSHGGRASGNDYVEGYCANFLHIQYAMRARRKSVVRELRIFLGPCEIVVNVSEFVTYVTAYSKTGLKMHFQRR